MDKLVLVFFSMSIVTTQKPWPLYAVQCDVLVETGYAMKFQFRKTAVSIFDGRFCLAASKVLFAHPRKSYQNLDHRRVSWNLRLDAAIMSPRLIMLYEESLINCGSLVFLCNCDMYTLREKVLFPKTNTIEYAGKTFFETRNFYISDDIRSRQFLNNARGPFVLCCIGTKTFFLLLFPAEKRIGHEALTVL